MEPENSLPQHDNASITDSDSDLHDQLTDRIDTLSQWLTILGNKIGVNEQKLTSLQVQINNINSRLTDIEKHLETIEEDVKARNAQLQGHDTHLLYLRAGELENVWDKVTDNVELEDIYILHGADVALDIQALNFLDETDQQRYEVAKVGFKNLYGFPFTSENEQKIINAPPEIRKTIDKRANLMFLRAWKWSSQTEYLVDMCDKILQKWENKLNWYYPNAQLRQDYEELEELYINKGE
jgi:ribosomal protein S15P/S13E